MKVDLTVLAIPGFVGSMVAEYAWQKRNPARGQRAGDYELADTLASLSMGVGSLIAPYVTSRILAPLTPRSGRYARALMGLAVVAAATTTAADVIRRSRGAGLPEAGTVRGLSSSSSSGPEPTSGGEHGAEIEPALRRITGTSAVTALASTVVTASTLWSAETAAKKLFRRSPLDLGTGPLGGRDPGVGPHLLLQPPALPREQMAVGHARGPSLERALQPLDRAAAARRRGAHRLGAVRTAVATGCAAGDRAGRAGGQPHLPVLDPHRGRAVDRAAGEGVQLTVRAPRAPRKQPALPGSKPRQHPHRVGSSPRYLRAGGGAGRVRADHQHRDVQPVADRHARVGRDRPRRVPVAHLV